MLGGAFRNLKDNLAKMASHEVLVGMPQAKASRRGQQVNNAELMFIHTNGSPLRGIPARPVIEPAIEDAKGKINRELKEAVLAAGNGDNAKAMVYLKRTGMVAQNACRGWFTNPKNKWAPNSPFTIKRKKSSRPLIDTGALRQSIIYIVRDK